MGLAKTCDNVKCMFDFDRLWFATREPNASSVCENEEMCYSDSHFARKKPRKHRYVEYNQRGLFFTNDWVAKVSRVREDPE